ncbi:hypothetical protein [Paracoccus aestuariivivens]|uniref:Uncharacterized protein n=1 Tax=Paracoccus aestuariivivens TaxID=1820333 RepID=A0A6L6J9M2_9RHOB|nr:hypothetical protein [Paracoccus aestuariivivens]MTH76834.1 hypothetical protein [Paracoccus aestuariivivens]
MRYFDFSSWHGVFTTLLGLAIFTLVGVGIRVLMLLTIQQRQQRMNRQINERLRTLIAAYKALGGSFTGQLHVDPTHLRELRQLEAIEGMELTLTGSDRTRRIRDAVEAALSDIILLGTEDQIRLASRAAAEMAAGRPIHTAELVVSLRDFIRKALDLAPVPADAEIPAQGPARAISGSGRSTQKESSGGGKSGGAGGSGGGGMGGMGGMGLPHKIEDE